MNRICRIHRIKNKHISALPVLSAFIRSIRVICGKFFLPYVPVSPVFPVVLMFVFCGSVAWAQGPEIGGLLPAGGPRGQATQVHIDGKNLTGARLYLSGSGVAVKSLQVDAKGEQLTAELAVETGARLGPHEVRVATPKGVSGGARFWVDTLPNKVIEQPMSEAMPPVEINAAVPAVINGRILNRTERDRFTLTAKSGETWSFDCFADRIRSRFDPVLEIRDEAGVSLKLAQSTWESDPRFVYKFAKAGRYFLTVRDSEYNGGPNYTYRLLAGRMPLIFGYSPRGGQPGSAVSVALQGSGLTVARVPVTLPADVPNGVFWAEMQAAGTPALIPLLVGPEPVFDAGEGQVTRPLPAFPVAVDGIFARTPRARFTFHAKLGTTYLFDLMGRRIGSRIDGIVRVLNAAGKEIAANDDAPGLGKEARLEFAPTAEGDYTVEAGNVEEVTGPDCYYRLYASLVQPDFKLAIETDRLAVPRGGTIELPITLERLGGYAGPVSVRAQNLPPGVHSQGGIIPAGKSNIVITLTTAPDAPFAASGIRLVGEAVIGGKTLVHDAPAWERYEHRSIDLLLSVEYSYTRPHHIWDMLLLAATERTAPLTVSTTQTVLTLAPGATLELPIHVQREANAAKEIKLEARNLPAKVTATLAPIPAGQSDGKLILKAAPDAPADIANVIVQATHENAVALAPALRLTVQKP